MRWNRNACEESTCASRMSEPPTTQSHVLTITTQPATVYLQLLVTVQIVTINCVPLLFQLCALVNVYYYTDNLRFSIFTIRLSYTCVRLLFQLYTFVYVCYSTYLLLRMITIQLINLCIFTFQADIHLWTFPIKPNHYYIHYWCIQY